MNVPVLKLVVLVELLLVSLISVAQSPDDQAFRQLSLSLSQVASNDPVVLLRSGIFADPLLDSATTDEQRMLGSQLNAMLKPLILYESGEADLSTFYSDILTHSEWATTPLPSSQRQELKKLKALLFVGDDKTPTIGYQAFLKYRKAYEEIRQKYDDTPENERTAELQASLQLAQDDLLLRGHQNTFEPAEARFQELQSSASLSWRDADVRLLTTYSRTDSLGNSFLLTEAIPAIEDSRTFTWNRISLTGTQLHHPVATPAFPLVADGRQTNWWVWGLTPSNLSDECKRTMLRDDFTVEFEAAEAQIRRDWFDPKVVSSQAWRSKSLPPGTISDGKSDGNLGTAPLYPIGIVLVRELRIFGAAVQVCLPAIRSAVIAHQTVRFGPFTLAGDIKSQGTSFYMPATITGKEILSPDAQLVGFAVTMLPRTPNPNEDFEWEQKGHQP